MDNEVKEKKKIIFRPQEGFQEKFLASSADIVIGGGSAGGGKSFAITMEALYDIDKPKFRAMMFRRKLVELDGLIDESHNVYSHILPHADFNESKMRWTFKSGATVSYNHLQYEKDKKNHQGKEYALIGFDELTHFSEGQFFYLLTRNRSTSGAKPRIRATCNPEPDSWVARLIDWWIGEDGFPIKERSGVLRYFVAAGAGVSELIWGNTKEQVYRKAKNIIDKFVKDSDGAAKKDDFIKSITFIPGSVYENKKLLSVDPGYLGGLAAQDEVTRAQLLDGNWKVKESGDEMVLMEAFDKMLQRPMQKNGRKCITCDPALEGKDEMVIMAWDGFHLFDCMVLKSSDGQAVVNAIQAMMRRWHISPNNVTFDANNLGGFIKGYIPGSKPFYNNGMAQNKMYYTDAKSECAGMWADRMNEKLTDRNNMLSYSIDENIANRTFGDMTLMEHLKKERKVMRWADSSMDGKQKLLKKSEMKQILGHSPNFMETFFMIESLYLSGNKYSGSLIF